MCGFKKSKVCRSPVHTDVDGEPNVVNGKVSDDKSTAIDKQRSSKKCASPTEIVRKMPRMKASEDHCLLNVVSKVLPCSSEQWKRVCHVYNRRQTIQRRFGALRKRYNDLTFYTFIILHRSEESTEIKQLVNNVNFTMD